MPLPVESSSQQLDSSALMLPQALEADWSLILLLPDVVLHPRNLPQINDWRPAKAPGSAFEAIHGRDVDLRGPLTQLHDYDIWYRTYIDLKKEDKLKFDGLAGLAELWIDDQLVASSVNMYRQLLVNVQNDGRSAIAIRFRSLNKALQQVKSRPAWRTKLVNSNNIRMYRQTLLGHMPGWCPNVHAVGPYRPIYHLKENKVIETCTIETKMQGCYAILSVQLQFLRLSNPDIQLDVQVSNHIIPLIRLGEKSFGVKVTLDDLEPWWPHTHGDPKLYDLLLSDDHSQIVLGRVGFRSLSTLKGSNGNEFQIEVNGLSIFCRGACWTSADLAGLDGDRLTYRDWLVRAMDAGMNMIRIGGTMLYESKHLHDLCDELGMMVWQDLMFASLDYPVEDPEFKEDVLTEVAELLKRTSASPSLTVICGGSEIAQQAAMFGLPRDRRSMYFFDTLLAGFISSSRSDVIYVPNSPWGGNLPFCTDFGLAHYYGVGAFKRPLEDARRANVSFAAECLAFANLGDVKALTCSALLETPQDPGTSWNFADTRDYYLKQIYDADPMQLRSEDPARYLYLSQVTTSDIMESVFSEWRRPKSNCSGGLVWQLQDLAAGNGWGVIDCNGQPKSVWYGLRRVLAPIQVLISDEGGNGLEIHVLNEKPVALTAILHLICINRSSASVIESDKLVSLQAHSDMSLSSYSLLDSFFDITKYFRFGPSEHEVTVAKLVCNETGKTLSQAFHFPSRRALPLEDIGLNLKLMHRDDTWELQIETKLFAQSVKIDVEGYCPEDNWFHMMPLDKRVIRLIPIKGSIYLPSVSLTALNSRKTYFSKGAL